MSVGVNISEQTSIWKHQMSRLSGPREQKCGLGGEKIKRYQASLGPPLWTVQFWRQTVKSVLLWWFLHQFMLRKSRCHT